MVANSTVASERTASLSYLVATAGWRLQRLMRSPPRGDPQGPLSLTRYIGIHLPETRRTAIWPRPGAPVSDIAAGFH